MTTKPGKHTTNDYRTCACDDCGDFVYNEDVCFAEARNAEIMERPRGEIPTDPGDMPEPGRYS